MNLNDNNNSFSLNVKGYEFLNSKFFEDLNWLNIEILAQDDVFSWKANGPFIRTNELAELYNWIKEIKYKNSKNPEIDFLEHELSFKYLSDEDKICINFDYKFHPKGNSYNSMEDDEYKMYFNLKNINLEKILLSLELYISKYPNRSN